MLNTILEKILNVTNNELDLFDMEEDKVKYNLTEHWYLQKSGNEHYRLLKYISGLFENVNLIDVGTFRGHSSVALSFNNSNTVYSFDTQEYPEIKYINKHNIIFKVENIVETKQNYDLLMSSPFIMLDTWHDGSFENQFYSYLKEIQWKGLFFLDDIYLNQEMKNFWDNIKESKFDLTKKAHFSGTGIVLL